MFWELTLRELDMLMRRRVAVVEREADFPAKLVCWMLVNIHRNREEHPLPLAFEEIFPAGEPEAKTETVEEAQARILERYRGLTKLFGGTDDTGLS